MGKKLYKGAVFETLSLHSVLTKMQAPKEYIKVPFWDACSQDKEDPFYGMPFTDYVDIVLGRKTHNFPSMPVELSHIIQTARVSTLAIKRGLVGGVPIPTKSPLNMVCLSKGGAVKSKALKILVDNGIYSSASEHAILNRGFAITSILQALLQKHNVSLVSRGMCTRSNVGYECILHEGTNFNYQRIMALCAMKESVRRFKFFIYECSDLPEINALVYDSYGRSQEFEHDANVYIPPLTPNNPFEKLNSTKDFVIKCLKGVTA